MYMIPMMNSNKNIKNSHILIIGGWNTILEKGFESGAKISYFGQIEQKYNFDPNLLNSCTYQKKLDITNIMLCLYYAKKIHKKTPLTGVVSFTESGLETASIIAEFLQIKGNQLDVICKTNYKDLMREGIETFSEITVPWKKIENSYNLQQFYNQFGPHIITKPLSGASSIGVEQISSLKDLNKFIKNYQFDKPFLAEKFIAGTDMYSAECFSDNGIHKLIGFTHLTLTTYPYSLVKSIVCPPYNLSKNTQVKIQEKIYQFLDTIGVNWGCTHTEFKLDENENPIIIETQNRVGGDRISYMISEYVGISQIDLTYQSILNTEDIKQTTCHSRVSAFLCLLPPIGYIKKIHGIEEIKELEDIQEFIINLKAGDQVLEMKDNTQRKGWIFLYASNQQSLINKINFINQRLKIEYQDGTVWQPNFKI